MTTDRGAPGMPGRATARSCLSGPSSLKFKEVTAPRMTSSLFVGSQFLRGEGEVRQKRIAAVSAASLKT